MKIRRRRYGVVVEDYPHMIFYLVEVEEVETRLEATKFREAERGEEL
ncbi:MAG: hypothetical protein GYA71_03615 [Bacteroidales bacterium]|jgi:hypothetical protein|nr:hypothetical protein [Bacteroidales bacterium]OQB57832.1 MAG: hypothetical protein BWX96_03114 [Bacteroidetes bacterium ADurb.Bin145]